MIPEVDASEAIALVANGVPIIDVREQWEWDSGHVPQASLLPLSDFERHIPELPETERFLVICHSGARSSQVTEYLVRDGFDAVNISGGILAWQAAGGEVVATPAA